MKKANINMAAIGVTASNAVQDDVSRYSPCACSRQVLQPPDDCALIFSLTSIFDEDTAGVKVCIDFVPARRILITD